MKVINFRHIGIPAQNLEETISYYTSVLGFSITESGMDVINGRTINWVKMKNAQGVCIEFQDGFSLHFAFTVDEINKDHYYFVAPSGCKVQFVNDPNGYGLEFVQEPKQGE
jgi:catechol-2,3-dioxygenase